MANASDFELKHTPDVTVEQTPAGRTVKVGIGLSGIVHPQTEEHYIGWIRVFVDSQPMGEAAFGPLDKPEASFDIGSETGPIVVHAFCNLHGIWEADA
jgi:superoxide reductase